MGMAIRQTLLLSTPSSVLGKHVISSRAVSRGLGRQNCVIHVISYAQQRRRSSIRPQCGAPDGLIGHICECIDKIRLQSIPSDIQTKVKYVILDGTACAIIGAKLPQSRVAAQAILDIEGGGKAPSLVEIRCGNLNVESLSPPVSLSLSVSQILLRPLLFY